MYRQTNAVRVTRRRDMDPAITRHSYPNNPTRSLYPANDNWPWSVRPLWHILYPHSVETVSCHQVPSSMTPMPGSSVIKRIIPTLRPATRSYRPGNIIPRAYLSLWKAPSFENESVVSWLRRPCNCGPLLNSTSERVQKGQSGKRRHH